MSGIGKKLPIIIGVIFAICMCNSMIIAAGAPGILINKNKYVNPKDNTPVKLRDIGINILATSCCLLVPLCVGIYILNHFMSKSEDLGNIEVSEE